MKESSKNTTKIKVEIAKNVLLIAATLLNVAFYAFVMMKLWNWHFAPFTTELNIVQVYAISFVGKFIFSSEQISINKLFKSKKHNVDKLISKESVEFLMHLRVLLGGYILYYIIQIL